MSLGSGGIGPQPQIPPGKGIKHLHVKHNGQPVSGAAYAITDSNGNITVTGFTSTEGDVSYPDFPGQYHVVVTKGTLSGEKDFVIQLQQHNHNDLSLHETVQPPPNGNGGNGWLPDPDGNNNDDPPPPEPDKPISPMMQLTPGFYLEPKFVNGRWVLMRTSPNEDSLSLSELLSKAPPEEWCCLIEAYSHYQQTNLNAINKTLELIDPSQPWAQPVEAQRLTGQKRHYSPALNDYMPTQENTGNSMYDYIEFSFTQEPSIGGDPPPPLILTGIEGQAYVHVLHEENHVNGATWFFYNLAKQLVLSGTTDPLGIIDVTLPAGKYTLKVRKQGLGGEILVEFMDFEGREFFLHLAPSDWEPVVADVYRVTVTVSYYDHKEKRNVAEVRDYDFEEPLNDVLKDIAWREMFYIDKKRTDGILNKTQYVKAKSQLDGWKGVLIQW